MANIIASGDGWRLEDDGTLYIYCVGDTPDYEEDSEDYPPWSSYGTIKHAVLSNSVTSIGNRVFENAYMMESVTIPDSVTSIGDYAFYDCEALTSVTIPDGITSIGEAAFMDCYALTSVTIPGSVTSIGRGAFAGCGDLTSVIISNGVTSIGEGMLNGCYALTSVTIPNSVTSIEPYAFYWCNALTSVTIPNSVTTIGESAFACDNLSDIYYSGSEAQWENITLYVPSLGQEEEYKNTADNRYLVYGRDFTVHYTPTYTVTFDTNGGTGNMSAQTFTAGTAQALTPNAFTRTGYTFGGWNTAANGSGTAYADGADYTASADTTLYAQWTQVVLSSITVTTPPTKTAYTAGDVFDPSGMVVTATYSDASTAAVTGYSVSPSGALTVNDSTVTINYTEGGVTATATVAITVTEATPEPTPSANRITIQIAKRDGTTLTFSEHAVKQLEYVQSTSFDGNDMQADEFSAVIRQTAPDWLDHWNGVNRASPVILTLVSRTEKYYFKELRRVGKHDFQLTAQSPLGRLTDDFRGGLYTAASLPRIIQAVIGNAIPESDYSINPLLEKVKVYGWIPYQERRTTLHQLALAYGFLIRRDENNNLYFTAPGTDNAYTIPDNAIFTGGSVDYSVGRTYARADITAYEYLQRETEAQILYDGSIPVENFIVRFETPMFYLHAENLTIGRSGVNYAEISGSGQLTGKPYTKIESIISVDGDADADPQHVLSVSGVPMITSLNAASVGERLLSYHNAPATVNMDILRTTQRSGDYVSFTDPFGDPQAGYITALSGSVTSIDRASASIACDYAPSWDTDYDAVMVLTPETEAEDDTWVVPEFLNGKRIRVVLIGGGTGGESGQHGTDSNGQGGNGGRPGAGGKVWDSEKMLDETFIVYEGQTFTYHCGAGGRGGYSSDELSGSSYVKGLGLDGEASTFVSAQNQSLNINFSSADGSVSNFGFYDVIDEILYAAPGTYNGISGGAATTGREDTQENDKAKISQGSDPEWLDVVKHSVSLPREWEGLELVSNVRILETSWESGYSGNGKKYHQYAGDGEIYEWAYGGLGGGATVGGDGSSGDSAPHSYEGGAGGHGYDADAIFPVIQYGGGGNGGHGGGEGGTGGKGYGEGTGGNEPTPPIDGAPGSGGYGSSGQNGADGCILIYYNRPDT